LNLHRLLAALSLVWAGGLPAAAAAAAQGGASAWPAFLVYGIGSVVCHQRAERSFYWGAVSWPVCARCTGIYLGVAAAGAVGLWVRRRAFPPDRARAWVAAAALPAIGSLGFEWITGVTPSNATRAATGIVLGAVLGWTLMTFLAEDSAAMRRSDAVER
jgi:uncharacterized membrane protein